MTPHKYDVVIVGAGICGAILAKQLGEAGKRVLILEAGTAAALSAEGYRSYVQTFYEALIKVPNSPYPDNPNAPSQNVLNVNPIQHGKPDTSGYFVQMGPLPFLSDYVRTKGGTTLHWLGTCLRMLPSDFRLKTLYGQGVDWSLTYDELEPYYRSAEGEIGVSADVEDQTFLGIKFAEGYVYPMRKIPQSYLDRKVAEGVKGLKVPLAGRQYEVRVVSTPQGRNSMPNPLYNFGRGYTPVGFVVMDDAGDPHTGERCEGNSSCVPICPVQAKYNALKTLSKAPKDRVHVITQAVASKIEIDPVSGRVTGIAYKKYDSPNSPTFTTHIAEGTAYVIAAHAVETAKLLLASNAANSSGQVGRNLMDHPTLLTWALMPQPVGSFRGPGSTSNVPTFRDGEFRKKHSAFIVPLDNWGWGWATGAPGATMTDMVNQGYFGKTLRRRLFEQVSRQFTLQFEFEQLPEPTNRVTIDPQYKDPLGNYRPVIHYDISDYTRAAIAVAKGISDAIFQQLGAQDATRYDPTEPGYLTYKNSGYTLRGAGHLIGTHRMGSSKKTSVVDRNQRTWDHPNLYLVGCGNMPTIGTSNPTLTVAALAFMAADSILKDLKGNRIKFAQGVKAS